ncbi:MAG: 3-phosphoshikimate 1-carboxyvinyltransferase [Chloroflexota bacterium]|nr:3-phosphoshikimate 1-carboxyvinyltransferase [Chloroflexota bacterium]
MNSQPALKTLPTLSIEPITHPLNASLSVPGSKSITNRALLLAALADGITRLHNALFSDDSLYLVSALQNLGFNVEINPKEKAMTVNGLGGRIPARQADLFIGNAGTAARFLTAFLTLGEGDYILDGEARMHERPIGDLVGALRQLGAQVTATPNGKLLCPPVRIQAEGLPGGQAAIAGNISSQFLSALLMVAPYAKQGVTLELTTDLNSQPYVDMTLGLMAAFGVQVEQTASNQFNIQPSRYSPQDACWIEPDASAAATFFAAPALCGGSVRVEGLQRRSIQGDIRFLDVLEQMGCTVTEDELGTTVSAPAQALHGVDVDLSNLPDTAQSLAVLAPFADSPTRIRGIASARYKECDRISATATELGRLGVQVEEHEDGLTIHPAVEIRPVEVQTYNDHRMAMAFALIGLRVPGLRIVDPGCVSKTFPDFFQVLDTLR